MRIRLPIVAAFVALVLVSAYLGLSSDLQFSHDKILHAFIFFLLALTFYWILDTHRKRCIQLTAVVVGGASVASEFVQAAVTTRTFDPLDIVSNIVGVAAAIALSSWYHQRLLERKRLARYELLRGSISSTAPSVTAPQPVDIEMGPASEMDLDAPDDDENDTTTTKPSRND